METVKIRVDVVTSLSNKIIKDIEELRDKHGEITLGEVIHAFGYYLFDSGMVVQREQIYQEIKSSKGMFVAGRGTGG